MVLVIDSADRERIQTVAHELNRALESPELARAALLIYANKQVFFYYLLLQYFSIICVFFSYLCLGYVHYYTPTYTSIVEC